MGKTNPESIENMQHVENKRDFDEEIAIYTKKDDELIIGDALLKKIECSSWNNKFYQVYVYANGYANCTSIGESRNFVRSMPRITSLDKAHEGEGFSGLQRMPY